MARRNPVSRFLRLVVVLFIPVVGRAQSTNKTVDDSYIHNSYQPNGTQSYLDGIQYHPSWSSDASNSKNFNSTYHYSTKASTNLIYFFRGDAVYYYGQTGGSDYAPVVVYLDGAKGEVVQTNTSVSSVQYQQLLWSKTGLGSGDHQIAISNGGQGGQVGMDYLVIESDRGFTPSRTGPAASTISPGAIIVDDNNLDYITYTGWETQVYDSSGGSFFYNNTIHRTTIPGTYFTFKFTGVAVWYITDTFSTHADVNITLDGVFNDIGKSTSSDQLSQRIIWQATDLAYGEHTIIVTHKDDRGLYATLDYFMYLPGEPPQKSSSPTGAIVGGVVGGVTLIALCVGGLIFVRRRRAAKPRSDIDLPGLNGPPLLTQQNGPSQPVTALPAWGYVSTPYSEPSGNSASSDHDREPRPLKGQLVTSPYSNDMPSVGPGTTFSDESTSRESYGDDPDPRHRDPNPHPPPYV